MGEIVLSTVGTAGDVIPFVALGQALKARGHTVSLLTHSAYAAMARDAGLNLIALDTIAEFNAFVADGQLLHSGPGVLRFLRQHVLPKIPGQFELLRQHCRPDTLIVARSTPGFAERLAAEALGLPLISVLMSPHHIASQAVVEMLLASLLSAELNRLRAALDVGPIQHWATWWRSAVCELGLWPAWFYTPPPDGRAAPALVGFVWHVESAAPAIPADVQAGIAGAAPILITGSTGQFEDQAFFAVSAAACARLGQPGLLIAQHPERVPSQLPASIRCVPFIPSLAALMPSFGAVIHHGGMGTVGTALAAGIPQVILAEGADRPDNGQHIERLGVGVWLPRWRWQPEIVAQSVAQLLRSPSVRPRCQHLAQQVRQPEALQAACAVIEAQLPSQVRTLETERIA